MEKPSLRTYIGNSTSSLQYRKKKFAVLVVFEIPVDKIDHLNTAQDWKKKRKM
jgi:hypothetical protein